LETVKTVLAIAGLDPSAGAGLLADIKTISAFGCFGVGVATSITFQNTLGVHGAHHLAAADVRSQLDAVLDDFQPLAAKTGMLPTVEIVEQIAGRFSTMSLPHLVVDPVGRSTSGYPLVAVRAMEAARERLFPMATLVTPNCDEAALLSGRPVHDVESMVAAGREILGFGPRAVLVTGGDLRSDRAIDVLVDSEGTRVFDAPLVPGRGTHGTGCALSTSVACLLAGGMPIEAAVESAREYVREAIRSAPDLGGGRGPLNHFPDK
jgi:hydroxymethylpyrimidine kinase/phosphomethylpyrimidine kinase